ncbi:MAG: ABC transporter ATP-binding protein [Planctomycetota bacterium]
MLFGANGCGKSTLLRVLAGLRTPGSGRVTIDGAPPTTGENRARLGLVLQRSAIDPLLSVRETIDLHARLWSMETSTRRERVTAVIAELGLGERARDRLGTLSGGWQRRVELARCLVTDPSVILLDEPTTGLDGDARAGFWDAIHARVASQGTIVFIASHDPRDVREAGTLVTMARGAIDAEHNAARFAEEFLRHESLEGARLVWCDASFESIVTDSGEHAHRIGDRLFVVATASSLASLVDRLSEAGAEFRVGHATPEALLEAMV